MRIAGLLTLTLAGCMPQGEGPAQQMQGDPGCRAESVQHLVGLPFDERDFDFERVPMRVLPPGSMMTMDHRPDRLNVDLDENEVITRIWCG